KAAGSLREEDAIDAMEMGARRMDFIGFKFEVAQEMLNDYDRAYQQQKDPAASKDLGSALYDISSNNGRCQDLRDGYGLTRDLYRAAWLKENRPYWLDNVSAQYELAMQLWIQRGQRFSEAQQQWYQTHTLPPPQAVGLPPMATPPTESANPPTVVPQ
ncbi:MAG: glycoside hydrolase, partial [Acidobacteriota bacterium]